MQIILFLTSAVALPFILLNLDINLFLFNIGRMNPIILVCFALPIGLLISFFHEFAHFCSYKSLGGKQNEIGFALMYRIIPIFYTATEDMILWKERKSKIRVASAGILSDFVFFVFLIWFQSFFELGMIKSITSFLVISILIKFIYNLNPLAPGSDMYFILNDFLKIESAFLKASDMINYLVKRKKNKIVEIKTGYVVYGIICYFNIFFYLLFFLLLITLPYWIKKIV